MIDSKLKIFFDNGVIQLLYRRAVSLGRQVVAYKIADILKVEARVGIVA